MASTDSFLAESMNAQVLTMTTSALELSWVSSCPACRARPSMTSESTRFLGQPREMRPIFTVRGRADSWIHAIEHPRVRNRFAHVLEFADPRDESFDAHSESAVGYRAVASEVEVPLERFLRQVVLAD